MIGKILAAIIFPGLLVILFTRVTYNEYISLLLTLTLITVSAYNGYTHSWLIIIIDGLSLTAGFWYAHQMAKTYKQNQS